MTKSATRGLLQAWGRRQSRRCTSNRTRPYRGWGRYPLARIRAQRAPVFSPAGTGTDTFDPEESPGGSRDEAPGDSLSDGRTADQGNRVGRHSRTNCLLALGHTCQAGRAHRRRRDRVLGGPATRRRMPRRRGAAGAADVFSGFRTPWGRAPLGAAPGVCPSKIRQAVCPCSLGSGCTTKRCRSCRCAGASAMCTTGRPASAAA